MVSCFAYDCAVQRSKITFNPEKRRIAEEVMGCKCTAMYQLGVCCPVSSLSAMFVFSPEELVVRIYATFVGFVLLIQQL